MPTITSVDFEGTKQQYEDFVNTRTESRKLLPKIAGDLLGSAKGGRGGVKVATGRSSGGGGRSSGGGREFQSGAPLKPLSITAWGSDIALGMQGKGGAQLREHAKSVKGAAMWDWERLGLSGPDKGARFDLEFRSALRHRNFGGWANSIRFD